ncbi:xin actin-binding repeat-containing protein 1-like [Bombina bombina]|uniref:xin actin-binding repeat-containing protein 1-like n=1 Tax=Bombina bombina TaxID=8345 RepID=UPI00235A7FF1|nr:xin actin-binding repeat-containing protein 1-like [Bombina bombina]
MAANLISSSNHTENKAEDLPLPPPPPLDSGHTLSVSSREQEKCSMPLPPPKESFAKFYEQRQANEVKRLYRHMHPELRKHLEQAVSHDLSELISTDEPNQQSSINLDAVLPGDVQSMRWIFENWTLDSIGEHKGTTKLADEEGVIGGNVKNTSLKFKGQPEKGGALFTSESDRENTKGDVKTALWLFETQPLDSLNKIYTSDTDVQEAVLKEPVERGDVKGTKFLFETHSLSEVGRCNSVEEQSILQLKSEIQELKGDVKKTVKLFQTEPLCAIRDKTGNIHEIKSVCREDTQINNVNTTRWLFETQPLDTFHKDSTNIHIIRGISLEELEKGGVNAKKWVFETQPLDTIKEFVDEGVFQASSDNIQGADVSKQRNLFEIQPCSSINEDCAGKMVAKEEVLAGDVKSSLWLFETQPMETLKGNFEVGQLQRFELPNQEKGDVKQKKQVFETCSLDSISKTEEESVKDNSKKDIVKGDVKSFKNLFETLPLDSIKNTSSVSVCNQEEMQVGNVKANQLLFETTPLYAIEDSLGNFHEVTSVSREQIISGDVKNYKWMFETKPLDQFNGSTQKVDIIKGITKQEMMSGDVRTAKWLFETQPVDVIHEEKNKTEKHSSVQKENSQKGDVKKYRWLFETQPVDALYDKSEKNQEKEKLPQGDVKSTTWMFETQPLDSLRDTEEQYIKISTVSQDSFKGVDVKTTKHLFETEPLENISSTVQSKNIIRYSSRVEIQSGEVSRVKEIFETKPKEGTSLKTTDIRKEESIQSGCVNKFTWLFENCPIDSMANKNDGFLEIPPEKDVRSGDVGGKKFIFETYSLDQIQREVDETEIKKVQEDISRGDVKSCTMLFESKPLYAIQDKGGEYHEVTSVKKEEIMKGDVRGAKWLFETKPLDRINKDEEVFVIRAVTQEDFEKGCVRSARWRFETEPLDSISGNGKECRTTVDDVQKGDVQLNKQLFESQQINQKKYVRLVSVSDVQKGNVRTSTWLFENQPIDCLKGDSEEHCGIVTVQREDSQKGDVKRCTWLFESQPLDSLKDTDTSLTPQVNEVLPKHNVKSTTWLFESTPLDEFNSGRTIGEEDKEIHIKDTLTAFYSSQIIQHKGIIIEGVNEGNVKMAKYQLSKPATTEILKEEIVGGNLQRILLQLLHRADIEPHGDLVVENSMGELHITKLQLLNQSDSGVQEEAKVKDNVTKALQFLLNKDLSLKTGIIMEESETASVKIIIYCVSTHFVFHVGEEDNVKGDVKSTIGTLIACSQEPNTKASVIREQNEKGNVQLYKSCIEKGNLEYLRNLQSDSEIENLILSQSQGIEQIHQDTNMPTEIITKTPVIQNTSNLKKESVQVLYSPPLHSIVYLADKSTQQLEKSQKEYKTEENNTTQFPSQSNQQVIANEESNRSVPQKPWLVEGNTQEKEFDSRSDLQSALLNLRQATEEAKNIQHQVQCKLQKTTKEIQVSSPTANVQPSITNQECASKQTTTSSMCAVQQTQKSHSSLQKSTASIKKVSAHEKEFQVQQLFKSGQEREMVPSTEDSIKNVINLPEHPKKYLNPFIDSDYNMQSVQEERENDIVRGDVKAAIRALQSSSLEQKELEKEEVIKGNLASALQSLEKSNVNISKGDFKAAMIYKNAGKSYSGYKTNNDAQQISNQDTVETIQQSDNNFPVPSATVMGKESPQPLKANIVEERKDKSTTMKNSVKKNTESVPSKTSENTLDENGNGLSTSQTLMPQRIKPVPPPKPKHLLAYSQPATHHSTKSQLKAASLHNKPTTSNTKSEILLYRSHEEQKQIFPSETQSCPCPEEHKVIVSNPKMLQKKDNNLTPCEIFVQTEEVEHVPILENKVLVKDEKCDKTMSQTWEGCENVKRRKGVTVVESKDYQGVVMRVKRKKETEDEKRKRLSVHKDEIMKGNVKAAMDIYENLRKQDELQKILNKVKELEEDTSNVDVSSMKNIFENVQDWVDISQDGVSHQLREKEVQKDENLEVIKDDTESISSMELAYEDLEKASAEIKHLKEQTLSKLLDIEETIKKALYSVSNLKSESDIVGLSGLFRESLGTSTNVTPTNNIRKISIVSSKAKPDKPTELSLQKAVEATNHQEITESKKNELDVTSVSNRSMSPASPSFITIESAVRKPSQQNGGCLPAAYTPKDPQDIPSLHGQNIGEKEQVQKGSSSNCTYEPDQFNKCSNIKANVNCSHNSHLNLSSPSSPLNSRRQKSVLELKTGTESPKLIGTTIVTEKYEESDQFGNKISRSKTSTTVTKQSDTQSPSKYEFVSTPPRYEVTASPLLRRRAIASIENSGEASNTGVVFVTFGNSNSKKK